MYGPHTSVLYIRSASLNSSLTPLTHHFLKVDAKPYKLQPGGPGYEAVYATTGVLGYLQSLAPSGDLDDAYALMAQQEHALVSALLGYLTSSEARARGVLVVGSERAGPEREPTISFVVAGERPMKSRDVVGVFDRKGNVSLRPGFSFRLLRA